MEFVTTPFWQEGRQAVMLPPDCKMENGPVWMWQEGDALIVSPTRPSDEPESSGANGE